MNQSDYTPEQKKDIEERVSQAKEMLLKLKLRPGAQVYKIMIDDNTFADKVMPYLQDTKYAGVLSPIQDNEDI